MYHFKNIKPANPAQLKQGCYIVLVHPNRIPPHLMLLVFGKFYSLSVDGIHLAEDLNLYLKHWQIKKTSVLFSNIKIEDSENNLQTLAKETLLHFNKVGENNATCLSPIKLFFEKLFSFSLPQVHFIFELLNELEKQNKITEHFSLQLNENNFMLKSYSKQEVAAFIDLSKKQFLANKI